MRRNNKKKGFTIVELVIVIAVIGILAAVMIPTFAGVISDANEKAALQAANNAYKEAYAQALADGKIVATKEKVSAESSDETTYDGEKVTVGDLTFIFVPTTDASTSGEGFTVKVYNKIATGVAAPATEDGAIDGYCVIVKGGVVSVHKYVAGEGDKCTDSSHATETTPA